MVDNCDNVNDIDNNEIFYNYFLNMIKTRISCNCSLFFGNKMEVDNLFACDLCEKSFNEKSTLSIHKRSIQVKTHIDVKSLKIYFLEKISWLIITGFNKVKIHMLIQEKNNLNVKSVKRHIVVSSDWNVKLSMLHFELQSWYQKFLCINNIKYLSS